MKRMYTTNNARNVCVSNWHPPLSQHSNPGQLFWLWGPSSTGCWVWSSGESTSEHNGLCSAPCLWLQAEQDHYTGLCSSHNNKRVCACTCFVQLLVLSNLLHHCLSVINFSTTFSLSLSLSLSLFLAFFRFQEFYFQSSPGPAEDRCRSNGSRTADGSAHSGLYRWGEKGWLSFNLQHALAFQLF